MRRQRLKTRHTRILAIGLGISLLVHGAILGLGRLKLATRDTADGPLSVVTLPDPVPEKQAPPEAESAGAPTALVPISGISFAEAELPAPPELLESRVVLAKAASSQLTAPLVPRPRITVARVESGLAPTRVGEPVLLALRERGRRSGGGIGVDVLIGSGGYGAGGDCAPGAVNLRYPSRSVPIRGGVRTAAFRLRLGGRR
jgi:hypothetical protein